MPQIPLSGNRLELSPCSFNPKTQAGRPDGYNHFLSEDTPREGFKAIWTLPPPPHPLLYDVDDDNYLSFGIMSASLPIV